MVNPPMLCYGRLLEHGWGINCQEQKIANGDLKVPLNLQNRSLTVQGRIKIIRDENESCLEAHVPEALVWKKQRVGSSMNMACSLEAS